MAKAKYAVGQLMTHKLFNYRGVIIDVDPYFQGDNDWYELMALSRPNKKAPWYYVLVHDAVHCTYVAEENIILDESGEEINHPDVTNHFSCFANGRYHIKHAN